MQDAEVQLQRPAETHGLRAPLALDDTGFVDFAVAGTDASGEFRCSDCGYGAVVHRALPPCPMCGGMVWENPRPRGVD